MGKVAIDMFCRSSVSSSFYENTCKNCHVTNYVSPLQDLANRCAHDSSPKRWEVLSDGYMLSTAHDEQEKEPSEISDRVLDDAEEVF